MHTNVLVAVAAALGVSASLLVASLPPAFGHGHARLGAKVIDVSRIGCPDGPRSRTCTVEGRVRIVNRRAPGSGRIVICVGIDVIDGRGRSLSIEPPTPEGQAIARLGPGRSRVTTYRTTFRRPRTADRPVVSHVHKHIVHNGGQQC